MDASGQLDADRAALLAIRASPFAAVIVFSPELRVVLAAGRALTALGLAPSDLEGLPAPDALALANWEGVQSLFSAAVRGDSAAAEIEAPGRDGWYRAEVEPLRDRAGNVLGGVCFLGEITQSKQLAEELAQQSRLLDLAHDAIIVREAGTSAVTYWNREAREIYGYSAEQARGRITHDLLATEFPESREGVDDALLRRGRWEGELWHVRKDGRRILVSSRQALVRDERDHPVAVIELNSDITERRSAEHALRAAEERFRRLVESAPDALVIVDAEGMIVLVSVRAEELFGYAREELIGQPVELLLPKGLRRRHVKHREEFIADPRPRLMGAGLELIGRRKGGGEFMAEVSLSPLETESGLLISAAVRDVSRQLLRQLEQSLVPRMKVSPRWEVAWRYRPSVSTMLLGGDFIGVCERPDGALSLLIGDVTGHGPAAAGTGAMLRAAWLGAAQAGVAIEAIPELLHRLLVNQADRDAGTLATVCLAEVDPDGREIALLRAGHDSPLLITRGSVTALNREHGPALGLSGANRWPLQRIRLPGDAAIMLFTDGLTERRATPRSARLGYDELVPRIDARMLLSQPPGPAIDAILAQLFPRGTEQLDDDLAVILLNLSRMAGAEGTRRTAIANSG